MVQKILTRDFVLCFLAQIAFTFVFNILIPTLPIYLSRLGSTEVEIGILIGIFTVSAFLLRPFIGRALLKTPEKNFMIIGALLYIFISVAYIFAPPFWPFLIVRLIQGIGFAFFHTATITLIANISPEIHRGKSLGYFTLASNVSAALAPSLGMFLINHFSFTILFLVCLGLSLSSLFITHLLGRRQVAPFQVSSIEDGLLISRKALSPSIVHSFALFTWGGLATFFPLYAINHGMANPGLFFTTTAIMLFLGRVLGGKILDLYSREKVILPCLISIIIAMIILAFSKTLPMFILVAVIWGIGFTFLTPSLIAFALDRVGSSPGPAMGTFTAISDLGMSTGPMIMGVILHSTSYPVMFLCLALIGFINLNYFYFFLRKKGG